MAASGAKMKNKKKKKKNERRHKEKWNMKNTFRNHLIYKASSPVSSPLRVFCFSLSFYYIFHFFFFLSDFAICQWNCLSTRCELKIWWWFNKTQFAPKECEVRKTRKTELIGWIVQLIKGPEFPAIYLVPMISMRFPSPIPVALSLSAHLASSLSTPLSLPRTYIHISIFIWLRFWRFIAAQSECL